MSDCIYPVIDGHFDLLSDVAARRKAGERRVIEREYLPELRAGGVAAVVASLFVDSAFLPELALRTALEQVAALHEEVAESPSLFALCRCGADLEQARAAGKIGFFMSFEGAEPVSGPDILRMFYELGVRGLGLCWSRRNMAADGCAFDGVERRGGLTELGFSLVQEAGRLGMFLDVSHLSDEGVEDLFTVPGIRVAATHSNARALCPTGRNLTDEQMRRIAAAGGVAGLNAANIIAARQDADATEERLMEHLDHMVAVMGEDHVGFGFDFCDRFMVGCSAQDTARMPRRPFDVLPGHAAIPAFVEKLRRRGYGETRLEKLCWSNWLRMLG